MQQGLHLPQSGADDYFLRPSLRLVDNLEVGTIVGTVDSALIEDAACANGDNNDVGNAIYLFNSSDELTDIYIDPTGLDAAEGPLTTAAVSFNDGSGEWMFNISFIPAGNYTMAFTCNGNLDNAEVNDANDMFGAEKSMTVVANDTAEVTIGN